MTNNAPLVPKCHVFILKRNQHMSFWAQHCKSKWCFPSQGLQWVFIFKADNGSLQNTPRWAITGMVRQYQKQFRALIDQHASCRWCCCFYHTVTWCRFHLAQGLYPVYCSRNGTTLRAEQRAPTQSFQFTAQSFSQPFTCVHRRWVLAENKDHTYRYDPSPGRMDSLSRRTWTVQPTGRAEGGGALCLWSKSWICSGYSAQTTGQTQKTPEGLQNRRTTLVGKNM